MKLYSWPRSTGKCFVCGKSTKLHIHQQCSAAANAKRDEPRNSAVPTTQRQYDESQRKRHAKDYVAGKLPAFMKT
jgi:hypothetical protein